MTKDKNFNLVMAYFFILGIWLLVDLNYYAFNGIYHQKQNQQQFEELYLEKEKEQVILNLFHKDLTVLKLQSIEAKESFTDYFSRYAHSQYYCDFYNPSNLAVIAPAFTYLDSGDIEKGLFLSHVKVIKNEQVVDVYNPEVLEKYIEINGTKCRNEHVAKIQKEKQKQDEAQYKQLIQEQRNAIEQKFEKAQF